MAKKITPLLDRALDAARAFKPTTVADMEKQLSGEKIYNPFRAYIPDPPLEYIKIPIVGSRTPEQLSADISDLLCWFQGVEFATPEEKSYKLEMARNGINAIRDIHHYIKTPMK